MKIFQVGGSVRDEIIGRASKDRDWLVVGGSEKELLDAGFRRVGKHFPVFLHPQTKEEYALARTETKNNIGHTGFETSVSKKITLEEDLARRDFTINAIAKNSKGQLIDPFGGLQDIERNILRHVTSAFKEDPLRILRAARFSATLGFRVAKETSLLMSQMVDSGELKSLSVERVEREFGLAMAGNWPSYFFQTLKKCGAISRLFPEVDLPELYSEHSQLFQTLKKYCGLEDKTAERYVIFCFFVTKYSRAKTSKILKIKSLTKKLNVPKNTLEMILLFNEYYDKMTRINELEAESILSLLEAVDAFRKSNRLLQLMGIIELMEHSHLSPPQISLSIRFATDLLLETKKITASKIFTKKEIASKHYSEITLTVRNERIKRIEQIRNQL